MNWQEAWTLDPNTSKAAGGQGEVCKVNRRSDGYPGALKQLHEDHQRVTERRYRAKQEADALHVLDGEGTPKLFDGNTEHWKDKEVPLYVVVEWIDGQTLAKRVNGSPLPLEKALQIARRLAEIVARCHELDVHHRDLKPDNVMLRGIQDDPILVDFGMSWTKPAEDDEPEFKTKEAQEIGNRFLRVPENAPGHHLHDARTDITFLVGLLFYMITGEQPRVLRDSQGGMPHESLRDRIPAQVLDDPRWERIRRLFNVGFEENPEHRIQSAKDLIARLNNLTPPPNNGVEDRLQQEIERFSDTMRSSSAQATARFQAAVRTAINRFHRLIQDKASEAKVELGVGGPTPLDDGTAMEAHYHVYRPGTEQPRVSCRHRVEVQGSAYLGSVALGNGDWQAYYHGPVGDVDGLAEASDDQAIEALASMLTMLREKLGGS